MKNAKKYNKFKWIALTAAGALVLGSMGGCQNSEEQESDNDGKITLTFAIWDQLQQDGMQQMVDAFEEENPDIDVKIELTPYEQYWTKMQASGTGGSMPDVLWMHPEQIYDYARGGKIMDLSEKIENSEITDLTKFPENVVNSLSVDGGQYAIPKDYSTFGLWYNKDIFDAHNMD